MSTNKTPNYQLHAWEPGDDFLRTEFNENFARIDQIPEAVTGFYTGDGEVSRIIELGFRPIAVLVVDSMGTMHNGQAVYGGLAVEEHPCVFQSNNIVEIKDVGFGVARGAVTSGTYYADTNSASKTYHFLAFKA